MSTRSCPAPSWPLLLFLLVLATSCGPSMSAPTAAPATVANPAPTTVFTLPPAARPSTTATVPRRAAPTSTRLPTLTPRPSNTPRPTATPWPTAVREAVAPETLRITIVYDNYSYQEGLESAWGFSALIEYQGQTLLFDTGGDPDILMRNMDRLGIDPTTIQAVALSHIHGDHVDGLPGLEERRIYPPVYIPPSFDSRFRSRFGGHFELRDVTPGQELSPGIFTTGEMVHPAIGIQEQSLVISTTAGLVVVTGCAHPGIVEIVTQAKAMFPTPVYLVLGGFHLGGLNKAEVDAIITAFRDLGVQHAAPTHCTGDLAIALFTAAYGDDFVQAGVGRVIVIE
jgi:7,8-dihydropterin-6-yl-methyl-4-(beta-D-ribofuranosyl)aminobenzene 5'-phosphate synthase